MIKRMGIAFITILISIITGALFMVLVYCIPVNGIREHAWNARLILLKEGDYHYWAPDIMGSVLDLYTDSLMLSSASFPGTGSPIQDAMLNPRIRYEGGNVTCGKSAYGYIGGGI